jgi:hypothetical protein
LKTIKISLIEEIEDISGEKKKFPKYTTQIINLANQNAQGTRPKVVGQMSELIQQCSDKSYEGWKKWYLERHPDSIENATQKIKAMINNLKEAILLIDEEMIRDWVKDLVLSKTAEGLMIQEIILKKVSELDNTTYEIANSEEEAQGIDGYIGKDPVSIKPISYDSKKSTVRDDIKVKRINYEIKGNSLSISWKS